MSSTLAGNKTRTLDTPLQRQKRIESAIKVSEALAEVFPLLCKDCKAVTRDKVNHHFGIEEDLKEEGIWEQEQNALEEMEFEKFHED
jgi:hypothetical protein